MIEGYPDPLTAAFGPQIVPARAAYDPNYDPVLEARRAAGRADPTSILDPIIHPLSPGGFLSPAPAREGMQAPTPNAPEQVAPAAGPAPEPIRESPGGAVANGSHASPADVLDEHEPDITRPSGSVPTLRETYRLPGGMATVDRGHGEGGDEWLASQRAAAHAENPVDVLNDAARMGRLNSGGGNVLFSGTGTLADLEGRERVANLQADQATRAANVAKSEAEMEDPFGLGPAQAKAGYEARKDVLKETAKGQADVATATAKEEARYAPAENLMRWYEGQMKGIDARVTTKERKAAARTRVQQKYDTLMELYKLGVAGNWPRTNALGEVDVPKVATPGAATGAR